MSVLDNDFGYRVITTERLKNLGFIFQENLIMRVDEIICTSYIYRIPRHKYLNQYHEFNYIPELNELRIKLNVTPWRIEKEYKIKPSCIEDIIIEINRHCN